jgi:hypothetical protein
MNSDEKMTKTKVVDYDKSSNFVVDNPFIWSHLWYQKLNLDGEMTKVVDYDKTSNFVVDNSFIWSHLWYQNSVWISYILKFKFFELPKSLSKFIFSWRR